MTDPKQALFTQYDDLPPSDRGRRARPGLARPPGAGRPERRRARRPRPGRVTGQQAADWIRILAARQQHADNRQVLERYAVAVEQVLRREIIPGSEGELTEELRYTLDAYVLCGSTLAEHHPELTAADRIALLAVGFTAASAPRVVLNDIAGDLALLCEAIDQTLALAAAAQPAVSEARP